MKRDASLILGQKYIDIAESALAQSTEYIHIKESNTADLRQKVERFKIFG